MKHRIKNIRKKINFLLFQSGTMAMETLLYLWASIHGLWILYHYTLFYALPLAQRTVGKVLNYSLGVVFVLAFSVGMFSLLADPKNGLRFRALSTFVIFCSCFFLFLVYFFTNINSALVPTYLVLTIGSLWVHLRVRAM